MQRLNAKAATVFGHLLQQLQLVGVCPKLLHGFIDEGRNSSSTLNQALGIHGLLSLSQHLLPKLPWITMIECEFTYSPYSRIAV